MASVCQFSDAYILVISLPNKYFEQVILHILRVIKVNEDILIALVSHPLSQEMGKLR